MKTEMPHTASAPAARRRLALAAYWEASIAFGKSLGVDVADLALWLEYRSERETAYAGALEMSKTGDRTDRAHALTMTAKDHIDDTLMCAGEDHSVGEDHWREVLEIGRKYDPSFNLPLLRHLKPMRHPVIVRLPKKPRKGK